MANKDNQYKYYIPMEMDKETAEAYGLDPTDVRPIRIADRITTGILYGTNDEELYLSYMRPEWREAQRRHRNARCIITDADGINCRCNGNCSECAQRRLSMICSLNSVMEGTFKEPSTDCDPCEESLGEILFNALYKRLEAHDPEEALIFRRLYNGASQRQIAMELGDESKGHVAYKIQRIRHYLQKLVVREDLTV